MLNERTVIVVVPAYCEEAHVGRVLETMPAFVDFIVVIDDASPDGTSEVARKAGGDRLRLVRQPTRRGVGAAIATGYRAALELPCPSPRPDDVIAVMAGDGQMAPGDLEKVIGPVIRGEADYVKGDRFGDPGVRGAMGWPRWVGGQVFSRLTSLAVGQAISDSQCGYTAISRRAVASLDLPGMWPSFGYPNDLLGQLAVRGARIGQVPVAPIYGTEVSKLRLRHLPPIFFLIARAAVRRAGGVGANVTRLGDVGPRNEPCGPAALYQHDKRECERPDRAPPAEAVQPR